jgi:hypothetical protein
MEFHALYYGVDPYVPPRAAEMESGDVAADSGEESNVDDNSDINVEPANDDNFVDEPSMGND